MERMHKFVFWLVRLIHRHAISLRLVALNNSILLAWQKATIIRHVVVPSNNKHLRPLVHTGSFQCSAFLLMIYYMVHEHLFESTHDFFLKKSCKPFITNILIPVLTLWLDSFCCLFSFKKCWGNPHMTHTVTWKMSLTMPKTVKRNQKKLEEMQGVLFWLVFWLKNRNKNKNSDVVSISILSSQGKQCHSNYNEGTNSSAVIPDCTHSRPGVLYVCM